MSPVRIDTARIGTVAGRSSAGRGTSAGASFNVDAGQSATRASAPAQVAATTSLDALLALQAVEDPVTKKRKLVKRGVALLDTLDAIRADVLTGQIGDGRLNHLMALIGQAREQGEPDLEALLDDIELRARVELAKRGEYAGL